MDRCLCTLFWWFSGTRRRYYKKNWSSFSLWHLWGACDSRTVQHGCWKVGRLSHWSGPVDWHSTVIIVLVLDTLMLIVTFSAYLSLILHLKHKLRGIGANNLYAKALMSCRGFVVVYCNCCFLFLWIKLLSAAPCEICFSFRCERHLYLIIYVPNLKSYISLSVIAIFNTKENLS